MFAQRWRAPVSESLPESLHPATREHVQIMREPDPSWKHNNTRFDALGPVLQCPPQLMNTFGTGDETKRFCGLNVNKARKDGRGESKHAPRRDEKRERAAGGRAAGECVIVSIGGANKWGFELEISRKMPHCHIHTLDCTVDGRVPAEIRSKVTFHKVCLGIRDETVRASRGNMYNKKGTEIRTKRWSTWCKEAGIIKQPDVLKMDIEGYEWEVQPRPVLAHKPLCHTPPNLCTPPPNRDTHPCPHPHPWALARTRLRPNP